MQLSSRAYEMVAAPVLSLLDKPYQYVSPYVERMDALGDQALSKVEQRFPVVKKSSPELLDEAKKVVYGPVKQVGDIYQSAYERTPGAHPIASGKAALKTAMVMTVKGLSFALQGLIKVNESVGASINAVDAVITAQQEALSGRTTTLPDGPQQAQRQSQRESQNQDQGQNAPEVKSAA